MKELFIYIAIFIVTMTISYYLDEIASYLGYLRFKKYNKKNTNNNNIEIDIESMKNRMLLGKEIKIVFDENTKKINADVTEYKKVIYIVIHGSPKKEFIEFAICHELAHIKLEHRKLVNSSMFIFNITLLLLILMSVLRITVGKYDNSKLIELEPIFRNCIILFSCIFTFAGNVQMNYRKQKQELDADYLATEICGYEISLSAISELIDSSDNCLVSNHPSNKRRINNIIEFKK